MYLVYRGASTLARAVPETLALAALRVAGVLALVVMPRRRRMVARHMRRVHGGHLGPLAQWSAVARVFASYGRYWYESFRLPGVSPGDLDARMRTEGIDRIGAALAEGRGAILALPHLGGWEFGGAWLVAGGQPLTVVVEPVRPPELFEWFVGLRRGIGLDVVPLGPAAGTAALRRLKAPGVVALVCDRDITGSGVDVEFFGETTTLPTGPATLALRTGAALLPAAVYFDGARGHRAVVRPPLAVERTGRLRDDVARTTQALAGELESLIRDAPEQWHLLQPNWPSDRRPDATTPPRAWRRRSA